MFHLRPAGMPSCQLSLSISSITQADFAFVLVIELVCFLRVSEESGSDVKEVLEGEARRKNGNG